VNPPGVYGTQGVVAATNMRGARDTMWVWRVGGSVWLFGGEGLNVSGADPNAPVWNDLWKYPVVAGGRYELYSNYPLQIQAVAASVASSLGSRKHCGGLFETSMLLK
jgi:hypothetical protein